MGILKSESLSWADKLEKLRAQPSNASRTELKEALQSVNSHITDLQNIGDCLDPKAIEKVRQAAQSNPPYILSFNSAKALVGLKGKVNDLPGTAHTALDVIFAHQLSTKKIKNLVKWIISGKPAAEFDPNKKVANTKEEKGEEEADKDSPQSGTSKLNLKKLAELVKNAVVEKALGKETTALKKLEKYLQSLYSSTSPSEISQNTSVSKKGFSETILLDWLLDIKIIAQIKSKAKKGKPLTKGEVAFLWLHKAGELLGHLVKFVLWPFKPFFKVIHWAWKMVMEALKELGLYKYAKAIFTLVIFIAVLWFGWEAFHYGLVRPVEMVWSRFHHEQTIEPSGNGNINEPSPVGNNLTQPSLSSQLVASAKAPKPVARHEASPHVMAYVPSVSFKTTDFDPKLLEQEIAAIPANSVIKDYVFQPDEGMPADLAVSRLQDLTDADKYTMMIGSGKEKILSFSPSNTNFTITYQSTDPFGILGGGPGKMNFFWEDVLYIHINEIDRVYVQAGVQQTDIKYQCTLVVKDAKNPLTIQCDSADDLQNLVSTMEYFIRNSRLGHDAQPAGMPYLTQGLKLNNDRVVNLLWANSPADKSGITLGDHLWSVGKITSEQQSRKDLEAELQGAVQGLVLYVASPSEWQKAMLASRQPGSDNSIHPQLRKIPMAI